MHAPNPIYSQPLDWATKSLQKCLQDDEKQIDQFKGLKSEGNGYYHFGHGFRRSRLTQKKLTPMPKTIAEQCRNMKSSCYGGLLPEIQHAWITVDKRLFLWDYNNRDRWVAFEEMSDLIVTVGIAKPKKDLFIPEVKHVLIVVTRLDIILFGLAFGGNDRTTRELYVYPSKYRTSTDGSILRKIVSTSSGRIFLCGDEGSVFEFHYDVAQDFLGNSRRKVRKINCTKSIYQNWAQTNMAFLFGVIEVPITHLIVNENGHQTRLYALTSNGTVQVYLVPKLGGSVYLMTENTTVLQDAAKTLRKDSRSAFSDNPIANIANVTFTESSSVDIMAITRNGDRIMLQLDGNRLRVKFVRLRPPQLEAPRTAQRSQFQPSITPHSPAHVSWCLHRDGITLLVDTRLPDSDTLLVFSRDPINRQGNVTPSVTMNELVETHEIQSRLISVEEMPVASYNPSILFHHYSTQAMKKNDVQRPLVGLTPYATQHLVRPRKFLGMTSSFFVSYEFIRPVDDLAILIRNSTGNPAVEKDIQEFFNTYGHLEACAMCLIIICSGSSRSFDPTETSADGDIIKGASNLFFHFGNPLGNSLGLNAMFQYLSRIIRPVWYWTITRKEKVKRVLRFNKQELESLQLPVIRFQSFLKRYLGDTQRSQGYDPMNQHQEMLTIFQQLVARCVEGFHMLQIMSDSDIFERVRESLDKQHVQFLDQLDFEQLVTSSNGRSLSRAYIAAMIRLGIGRPHIEHLTETCPTFFADSEHLIFQANKIIEDLKKSHQRDRQEKKMMAMAKYKQACVKPDFNLRDCCNTLRCAHLFYDIVELVDYYVEKVYLGTPGNPQNVSPQNAYLEIISCLTMIVQQKDRFMTSSGEVFVPIPSNKQLPLLKATINRALQIKEENFLFMVYDTLLNLKHLHLVFAQKPSFLENFLRQPDSKPERWKYKQEKLLEYYDSTKEVEKKVGLLYNMAHSQQPQYSLRERHDFLNRARFSANDLRQMSNSRNPRNRFSDQIQSIDKLIQASEIQIDIVQGLIDRQGTHLAKQGDEQKIEELKSQLMDIYQLEEIASESALYLQFLHIVSILNREDEYENVLAAWTGIVREQLLVAQERGQRDTWLDILKEAVVHNAKPFTENPETLWLVPYEQLLMQIENLDAFVSPDRQLTWSVASILELAGIPRTKILAAYCRNFPELSNADSPTRFRLLQVQLIYLDHIEKELAQREFLSSDDRSVLQEARNLAVLLEEYTRQLIAEDREGLSRFHEESQRVLMMINQLLPEMPELP